jgi:hypothetical protein
VIFFACARAGRIDPDSNDMPGTRPATIAAPALRALRSSFLLVNPGISSSVTFRRVESAHAAATWNSWPTDVCAETRKVMTG